MVQREREYKVRSGRNQGNRDKGWEEVLMPSRIWLRGGRKDRKAKVMRVWGGRNGERCEEPESEQYRRGRERAPRRVMVRDATVQRSKKKD